MRCSFGGVQWQVTWLDPGVNTPGLVFPEPQVAVKALSGIQERQGPDAIACSVVWTPRQARSKERPYIYNEFVAMQEALVAAGITVQSEVLFADEEPSLDQHFRILQHFSLPHTVTSK